MHKLFKFDNLLAKRSLRILPQCLNIIILYLFLFILLYYDQFIVLWNIKFSYLWKTSVIIIFTISLLKLKRPIPLVLIILCFILKSIFTINPISNFVVNLSESIPLLVLPLSYYYFIYKFEIKYQKIDIFIIRLILFFYFSTIFYLLNIIPQNKNIYNLSRYGIDSFDAFVGVFNHATNTGKIFVVSVIVLIHYFLDKEFVLLNKNLLLGFIIVGVFIIFYNFTKSAWFSFYFGTFLYFFMRSRLKFKVITVYILILSIVSLSAYIYSPIYVKLTGASYNEATTLTSFTSARNVLICSALKNSTSELFSFLIGIGKNGAGQIALKEFGIALSSHSKVVDILQYFGLFGLLIYFYFLLKLFNLIFWVNSSKNVKNNFLNILVIVLSVLYILYMIPSHGFPIWVDIIYGGVLAKATLLTSKYGKN